MGGEDPATACGIYISIYTYRFVAFHSNSIPQIGSVSKFDHKDVSKGLISGLEPHYIPFISRSLFHPLILTIDRNFAWDIQLPFHLGFINPFNKWFSKVGYSPFTTTFLGHPSGFLFSMVFVPQESLHDAAHQTNHTWTGC